MYKTSFKKFRTEVPVKKKKSHFKLWLFIILFISCFGGVIYFLNLSEYQIKNIKIDEAIITNESDVRSVADEYISSRYFFLIPKSHIWFYPKSDIKEKIESLPSIVKADVLTNDEGALLIKLTERKQDYLWCKSTEIEDSRQSCFYMDKDGFVFASSPAFEGHVFLTFFGMITDSIEMQSGSTGNDNNIVGKNFLAKDKMSALIYFIDSLKQFELIPTSVNAVSIREVRITLRSGTVLIINLDDDLDSVTKNIITLLQAPEFIKASGGINALEYIDLRYGAKAFWKPKGSVK